MLKNRTFLLVLASLLGLSTLGWGMRALQEEEVFSPFTAQVFHKIAYELYQNPRASSQDQKVAMELLLSATDLDPKSDYVMDDIIRVGVQFDQGDYARYVNAALDSYLGQEANLALAYEGVRYLLERVQGPDGFESRQARIQFLTRLQSTAQEQSPVLASTLETQRALLMAEVGDFEQAAQLLQSALAKYPFNEGAYESLQRLYERQGVEILPVLQAKHARLFLRADPMNLTMAMQYAWQLQSLHVFDSAANAYAYCADLFEYLYPDRALPDAIYLPWALNHYQVESNGIKCLEIARKVRSQGTFDYVLEAVAGRAARRTGDPEGLKHFAEVEGQLQDRAGQDDSEISAVEVAWFYSFATEDKEKALAWANQAYGQDPNDPAAQSILALNLVWAQQFDVVSELISGLEYRDQIARIAQGMINLAQDRREEGLSLIKEAVAMDPISLASNLGREQLEAHGSEYLPPVPPEVNMSDLLQEVGTPVVPQFKTASELVNVELNFSGSEFGYGHDFGTSLVIRNLSSEPLLVGAQGLLKGEIRIDVHVNGDIEQQINKLINTTRYFGKPISPGSHLVIPLELMTGRLRRVLKEHPQADLKLEFRVFLDPIPPGKPPLSRLPDLIVPPVTVLRPRVALSRDFIMQRLEALSDGTTGQKTRVIQLFAGLLLEQYVFDDRKADYPYAYVERDLLRDTVRKSVRDENWLIRIQAMAQLLDFPTPLEYGFLQAVSDNLNHDYWPVRMMALYTLSRSRNEGFQQVLDWTVQNETKALVQRMAISLGANVPDKKTQELEAMEPVPLE